MCLRRFITNKLTVYLDQLKKTSQHHELIGTDYNHMINFLLMENEDVLFITEFYIQVMDGKEKYHVGSIRFDKIEFREYNLNQLTNEKI